MDEDVVELDAADREALRSFLSGQALAMETDKETGWIRLRLPKGQAKLEELNRTCMQNGIVLTHLFLRRKKLETRFFELTND
jgi:ABC-2 type transport system ATP-binding protein